LVRRLKWVAAFVLLAACSASSGDGTVVPTQSLILPTATPEIVTPTVTPTPLLPQVIAPGEVLAPAMTSEDQMAQYVIDELGLDSRSVTVASVTLATADCDVIEVSSPEAISYRVVMIVDETVLDYRVNGIDTPMQCAELPLREVHGELLTLVDPIAADMVALAQRRLATQLDLPTRRVRLVDVQTVTWTDSSLGCPVEGQTYNPAVVDGFRVEVAVADDVYIFHTNFESLMRCDPGDEVLPD
jgi:hypothetical protein